MSESRTAIYSLYIINKAGGLIFQKDFFPIPKLAGNDYLRLASTFHSLHAITARGIHITPSNENNSNNNNSTPPSSGIVSLESRDFRLHCFATLT
jgi:hypothetical protein